MAIRMILADFDGTLVDSMPWWVELPKVTLRKNGVPVPEDMDMLTRSRPMWQIAAVLTERYPVLGQEETLYSAFMDSMRVNYAENIPMKPGAYAFLRRMKDKGMPVTLLSATNHGLLDPALESYGITPLLCDVITEGDVGASKRTGAPFEFCMERFGLAAEELLLLEDSLVNIRAARSLGVRCVGVADTTMAADGAELRECTELFLSEGADWEKIDALCGI